MALSVAEGMLEDLHVVHRGLVDVKMQSERFIGEIDAGIPIERRRIAELAYTLERIQKPLANLRSNALSLGLRPIAVLVENVNHEVTGLLSIINSIIRSIERNEMDVARKKLELVIAITGDLIREVAVGMDALAAFIVALRDLWKKIAPTA